MNAEVRMRTYEALISSRGLGEGDSDQALWRCQETSNQTPRQPATPRSTKANQ